MPQPSSTVSLRNQPFIFNLFIRMHTVLSRLEEAFPELDDETPLDGSDAVDRIAAIRESAIAVLADCNNVHTPKQAIQPPPSSHRNGLHLRTMGKWVRITMLFTSDAKANAYLERHPEEGVIAVQDGVVLIAAINEPGTSQNERAR